MPRIKLSPEQVRTVAGQFKTAGSQSQEMVGRLQNTMNGIAPEWEGMSKERFFQQYTEWSKSMTQFVTLLGQISTELEAIASRFEAADQSK